MKRRTFIKGLVASVSVMAGTSAYSYGIERHHIDIPTVKLDIGLGGRIRVAALGDIHFDPLYEVDYLTDICENISRLNPDLILYTGDLFSYDSSRANELASILSARRPTIGSFAVLGNHDFWSGASCIQKALEDRNIRVLRNATFAIPGLNQCYLTGLESYWAGRPDPSIISRTFLRSRHILLVHEPDPFDNLVDSRIRLQISGHTHGGQVRAPLIGALRLPLWGRNYDKGLFSKNGRFLYVNRGIGTLKPYVRFNCRPEITLFELS